LKQSKGFDHKQLAEVSTSDFYLPLEARKPLQRAFSSAVAEWLEPLMLPVLYAGNINGSKSF
jgi:hypothetical protein